MDIWKVVGFHGTNSTNGKKILKLQQFITIQKDHLHLGNGVYFYDKAIWAFNWTTNKIIQTHNNEEILKYCMIIKVLLNTSKKRIFDLDNPNYKQSFLKIFDLLIEKQKKTQKYKRDIIYDGLVLNYMFNSLEFGKNFDYVQCIKYFEHPYLKDDNKRNNTRFKGIHYIIICVKNTDIIKNIKKHPFVDKINDYIDLLSKLKSNPKFVDIRTNKDYINKGNMTFNF